MKPEMTHEELMREIWLDKEMFRSVIKTNFADIRTYIKDEDAIHDKLLQLYDSSKTCDIDTTFKLHETLTTRLHGIAVKIGSLNRPDKDKSLTAVNNLQDAIHSVATRNLEHYCCPGKK